MMAARMLATNEPIPKMEANAMAAYCETLLAKLSDQAESESLLVTAADVVSRAVRIPGHGDRRSGGMSIRIPG
jgi:hypothetical protein